MGKGKNAIKIDIKLLGAIMFIISILMFIKLSNSDLKNELYSNTTVENYKPVFKEHGVWHLYNFNKDLVDDRIPLEGQLFEYPDSTKFNEVDMNLVHKLLEKYLQKSKMMMITPGDGSGIVICGHDGVSLELFALVSYIRSYTTIPIEIYHADDLSQKNQDLYNKMTEIKFINLKNNHLYSSKDLGKDPRQYYLKPLAMLSTNFENVIYLDSDAFPLLHLDNKILDKTMKYLETVDMLLFRDYWLMHDTNPVFNLFEQGYSTQRQTDSGIVVFKKSQVVDVLLLSYFISAEKYFDKLFFGDKVSFQ